MIAIETVKNFTFSGPYLKFAAQNNFKTAINIGKIPFGQQNKITIIWC